MAGSLYLISTAAFALIGRQTAADPTAFGWTAITAGGWALHDTGVVCPRRNGLSRTDPNIPHPAGVSQ